MNLLSRLVLVAVLIFAGFAAAFWFTARSSQRSADSLLTEFTEQRLTQFASARKLQGLGLESLTSSYAWWDEMVAFMDKPEPKWATDHLDTLVGVPNGGDALWVLTTDLTALHAIDEAYRRPPVPFADPAALRRHIGANFTFQFYAVADGRLWQIFGAAIQSAQFWRNATPVRGYLLIGKRWDETWLARLGTLTDARLDLRLGEAPAPALAPASGGSVFARTFQQPVTGLDGATLATIHGRFNLDLFSSFDDAYHRRLWLLGGWILATFAATGVFIVVVIVRPLGRIIRALETKNPLPLADLLAAHTEFGEVARLLAGQLRRDRMLQEEIRRHLDNLSPEQRARDTESNEALRLRLAGNLHDGPMQSLYAAGLQLASVEADVIDGKPVTPDRLQAAKGNLTQATADLRNLLLDLEPEELRDQDLETALHRIESRLRSISRGRFQLELPDGILDGISRDAQLHLFYICRELASNAMRHASPAEASLRFSLHSGFLHLDWSNDGLRGRLPPGGPPSGNGLRNIAHRVSELGGTWRFGPADHCWRVHVELPCTSLAATG